MSSPAFGPIGPPARGPDPRAVRQWADVARQLRRVPRGRSIEIRRGNIVHPTYAGAEASMGLPVGQLGDFRFPPRSDGSSIHVHDLGQAGWRVHVDEVHPAVSLYGHLWRDVFRVGAGSPVLPLPTTSQLGFTGNSDGTYDFGADPNAAPLPPEAGQLLQSAQAGGLTEADAQQAMNVLMGVLTAATGGAIGPVWLAWLAGMQLLTSIYGTAGEGPGGCITDPGSVDFSWTGNEGDYTAPLADTFEQFAELMILADWTNVAQCPADPTDPDAVWWSAGVSEARMPAILLAAVAIWNATHSSAGSPSTATVGGIEVEIPNTGGTRTITSIVLNSSPPDGTSSGFAGWYPQTWSPIDVALNAAAVSANQVAGVEAGDPTDYGVIGTTRAVAPGSTVNLEVANGPAFTPAGTQVGDWVALGQDWPTQVPPQIVTAMSSLQIGGSTWAPYPADGPTTPPVGDASGPLNTTDQASGTGPYYANSPTQGWFEWSVQAPWQLLPASQVPPDVLSAMAFLITAVQVSGGKAPAWTPPPAGSPAPGAPPLPSAYGPILGNSGQYFAALVGAASMGGIPSSQWYVIGTPTSTTGGGSGGGSAGAAPVVAAAAGLALLALLAPK